jgi:DNA-binding MarR family transcriptional regulator
MGCMAGSEIHGTTILLYRPYLYAAAELQQGLDASGHEVIRPAHGVVFEHIGRDGARVTTMAEAAGMTKQAMTELVDHLERHGYVERAPDPTDRRAKLVRLTEKGFAAVVVAEGGFRTAEREFQRILGDADYATLRSLLVRLNDALPDP